MLLRELNPEDRRKFLGRTLSETIRLQNLVDSILVAARLESQSYTVQRETIDLVALVEQTVAQFRDRIGTQREIIFEKIDPLKKKEFLIDGDTIQLQMVFDNLLSNAFKYTSENGQIKVLSTLGSKGFSVDIQDNGVGIEKDALKKIFDKFYRAEGTSRIRVQGSGLGLFIARSVVLEHGGNLIAESEGPEKGAEFHVEFQGKIAARRG
jgi:signal transduction histidine kinase